MVSEACGHFLVVKSRVFYNQISEIRTVDPNWEFYNNNIRLDLFWRRRIHFFVDKHCIYNNVTRFVVSQTNSGFNYYNEKKRSPGSGNVRYRMSENFGFASANFDELSTNSRFRPQNVLGRLWNHEKWVPLKKLGLVRYYGDPETKTSLD